MVRKRRIANLEALQEQASQIAHAIVRQLESRHYLIWWLSSYDRIMKRGYYNETIALSPFQVNEFRFSYKVSNTIERIYLLVQPENWFFNDLGYESASVDEFGIVLNLSEINNEQFKLYVSRMQIRFNFDEIHAERLKHAKKYAKELVLIKYEPKRNEVKTVGVTINLNNSSVHKKSGENPKHKKGAF